MAIRAKWRGSDPEQGHLYGIPAADIEEADYQALDAEQRKAVRDCGLYDVKTDDEMAGTAKPKVAKKAKKQTAAAPSEGPPEAPTEAAPVEDAAASSEEGGTE